MKCYNARMLIRGHITILLTVVAFAAFARKATVESLPVSPYADTEVATNVVFGVGVAGNDVFSVSFELDASPSNNVEVAFGHDANANGILDDSEAAFALGWDSGEWFFRDIAADVAGFCVGSCGHIKFDWNVGLDSALAPRYLRASAGGALLPFQMMNTMYDPAWNMARVTARGLGDSDVVVKFGASKEPFVIRMR